MTDLIVGAGPHELNPFLTRAAAVVPHSKLFTAVAFTCYCCTVLSNQLTVADTSPSLSLLLPEVSSSPPSPSASHSDLLIVAVLILIL